MTKRKCCLCGEQIIGYGNNALPLSNGFCCDDCNLDVIFERCKKMEVAQ